MLDRLRDDLRLHAGPYILLAALFAGVALTPMPYVRTAPGSTYDALGKEAGTPLVSIKKTPQYPVDSTKGEIRILTVSQWGGPYGTLSWFDAARSLWDHAIYIVPTRFLFAENTDPAAVEDESQIQFASAESSAVGAAMHYLKLPVKEFTSIVYVDTASPNFGLIKVGDQIVSADGHAIVTSADFGEVMKSKQAGDTIALDVLRGGKKKSLTLTTYVRDGETKVRIGVILLADFMPPMPIMFGLEGVGGPSAGLAFSLALVDKLDGEDLVRSRTIAVTGEISSDGSVGAIGGIPQKLASAARAGASLVLIPRANCPVSAEVIPPELTVVPVDTLSQAVEVLKASSAAAYPTC